MLTDPMRAIDTLSQSASPGMHALAYRAIVANETSLRSKARA